MPDGDKKQRENDPVPAELVREALADIVGSEAFAGAERLKAILSYVVEETLEGRGPGLRAKTVGLDVYGYSASQISQRENVVRVDAGRLRRKLETYYKNKGRGAAVVIDLPKGGYIPEFHTRGAALHTGARVLNLGRKPALWAGAAAMVLVIVAAGFSSRNPPSPAESSSSDARLRAERSAIFETSPSRLEAANLARIGRTLIFPAVNPGRLKAALLTFEAAIEIDAAYFGGFAGAAQVHATRAALVTDPAIAARELELAEIMSREAARLAPSEAWSQSALAWTAFAKGDPEAARQLSARALALDPTDPHIVEFDALISLYLGDFERVKREAARIISETGSGTGFVFQNALGAARYHSGEYDEAISAFEATVAAGGPAGPITVAYLMAAHARAGRAREAAELARSYTQNWPGHRADLLFERLFVDPDHGRDLGAGMRRSGWSPAASN